MDRRSTRRRPTRSPRSPRSATRPSPPARAVVEAARAGAAHDAIAALGAFRILCAHRRGAQGVAAWTARIEGWLAAAIAGFDPDGPAYVGRPLLVTQNDYELRLYNGDTGVVVQTGSRPRQRGLRARRASCSSSRPTRLGAIETAFAMTIHKSQGSQFDTAVVLLPAATSRILTRELLYTAATRARTRLVLVGTEETIRAAVSRPVARASGLRDRLWSRRRLLARRPSPRLAAGELTHLTRVPVDADLALAQWQGYVDAFREHGWEVTEIEPADEHPDGVFVEDAVVVFGDLAVLTSPGAESRRGELATVAAALEAQRLAVHRIEPPGTLDGGDVLKVGRTAYVGRSARTNEAGIEQLRAIVEPAGWTVVAVPVTKVLHLKSGVTALPDGTVIGRTENVDDLGAYPDFMEVPEEHGTAVVDLGEGAVLMSADAPRTAALLRARGLHVVAVPISEFEKLEGCVTCLSVRIRRPA